MTTYVVLLRGINVGGKNTVSMAALKSLLVELGYMNVSTYIVSGNVVVESDKPAARIKAQIETALTKNFDLDDELIKVLVLSHHQLRSIIENKPKGFGDEPGKYHSDVIFLMEISVDDALPIFNPREGVDAIWPGDGVIYSRRLSAERTKSRLSAMMASPLYKSMTIRNWNTTTKLLAIADKEA
jgi:uncharacterized protein (DUF1697 family)